MSRCICYCDDCQAFAHYLGRPELLDAHGGTNIVQVAPATLTFQEGAERIAGLRLKPKGLYRFYASCCKTPLGNMMSPAVPYIGVVAQVFDVNGATADQIFGPDARAIQGKFAIGEPPPGSTGANFGFIFSVIRKVIGWKLGGSTWPHPYFDRATGQPAHPVTVLSPAEREALRPLCGPRAAPAS